MRFLPSDVTRETTARRLLGEGGLARLEEQQRQDRAGRPPASRPPRRAPDEIPPNPLNGGQGDDPLVGEPALPSLGALVGHRLCHGLKRRDIAQFQALGPNDAARMSAWLTEQFSSDPSDPGAALETDWGFTTLTKTEGQLWLEHYRDPDWQVYIRPLNQLERRTIGRATHSTRQLQEVIVNFWHNHFSVYGEDAGPMMVAFDRDAIRAHAMGNFLELLRAVVKSWAMLNYLDNKYNSYAPWAENDGINENFARELLELHTLGDEHYYPGQTPDQVPDGLDGYKIGFTDTDVTQAARCLTGWTTEDAYIWEGVWPPFQYQFSHYAEWHDDENVKNVLGLEIDNLSDIDGGTEQDGEDLLNLLANHRGTAVFICRKLCRRLISDDPPESIVQSAADVFQNNTTAANQIELVVRHIAESSAFATTFGEKIKRPFEVIVSQMRAVDYEFALTEGDDFQSGRAGWFMWQFYLTGNLPFDWGPPNGFPDFKDPWIGSSPRVLTWWFSNFLCNVSKDNVVFERYIDVEALMQQGAGADPRTMTPRQIVDYWIDRMCGRTIPNAERRAMITFMADGADQNTVMDASRWNGDWNAPAQIRTLISLIAMSPSFLYR